MLCRIGSALRHIAVLRAGEVIPGAAQELCIVCGRCVVLLKERGGSGHVRGAPLDYLSWPRFGGLVASYVFSILSIVRLPSRIMYFSAPPFACVFAMYVPFHTGLFVACFRAGFFSFSFPPGRARLGGFLRINTLSFTATPPLNGGDIPS